MVKTINMALVSTPEKLPEDYQKTAFWWSRSTNPSLEEKQTFMEGFDHNFLPKYKRR